MTASLFTAMVPFFILILFYFFYRLNRLEKYLIARQSEENERWETLSKTVSELQDAFEAESLHHDD